VEAGFAGEIRGGLHEAEEFDGLQAAVESAFVRLEIFRIPASPAGGFAVDIVEGPAVIDEVVGDAGEVASALFDFGAFGNEFEEQRDGVEMGGDFVAGSIALPFEKAVAGGMPFSGVTTGTMAGLVSAFALGQTERAGRPGMPLIDSSQRRA